MLSLLSSRSVSRLTAQIASAPSRRGNRLGLLGALAALAVVTVPQLNAAQRPAITSISHLATYAADMQATDHYYVDSIGAQRAPDPENPHGVRYMLSPTQFVEVLPLPPNAGINRLDHSAWNTTDAAGLRAWLAAKGWKTPSQLTHLSDGSLTFRVHDPEGNLVEFVQPPPHPRAVHAPRAIGHHIIHIGIMVHSRATEDTFYRALLGFRPYWFGGMHDNKIDWVSQQVPDGHDWLEYMLASGPAGIPPGMTQQALGVLDHLSIGVVSVPAAYSMLAAQHRLTGHTDKHTQIGRDGKEQFNLYDPDGIRLELMEFHAVAKPCCSPFTATDPTH